MSASVLQRIAVRMLYDAEWVDRVYDNPSEALLGLDITREERSWLTQPDIRRWKADPHRSHRGLQSLLEEYCVTAGAILNDSPLHALHRFFCSDAFHNGVMAGHSLALTFGDWLGYTFAPYEYLSRIEREIAEVRRRRKDVMPAPSGTWVMADNIGVVITVEGALDIYANLSHRISHHSGGPLGFLLGGATLVPDLTLLGTHDTTIIVESVGPEGNIQLSSGDKSLGALMNFLRTPRTEKKLQEMASSLDSDASEIVGIVRLLWAEGLIRHVF